MEFELYEIDFLIELMDYLIPKRQREGSGVRNHKLLRDKLEFLRQEMLLPTAHYTHDTIN